MKLPKTLTQFLVDAHAAHGDKYDYSQVEYTKSYEYVTIGCKRCQSTFRTFPANHTHRRKSGCPKCSRDGTRLTLTEFLERARAKHGERYDYSLVHLNGCDTKVDIRCRTCSTVFGQTPSTHFVSGCQKCFGMPLKTTEQFVANAIAIHGDKYDYSRVVYQSSKTPVEIVCRTCDNSFLMSPNNHLSSKSDCECQVNRKHRLSSLEKFVERARVVHGDKYDYSLSKYVGSRVPMTIMCSKGHIFKQTPSVHTNAKCGCPQCTHIISAPETQWLDTLNVLQENRQQKVPNTRYQVDALQDRTIYEFYGAFWHGDIRKFPHMKVNPKTRETYGEMYQRTIRRHDDLVRLGYDVKYIWEVDYKKGALFSERHPTP